MLNDYSKQPQDTRYDRVISPPFSTSNIPKVFVRCSISHYNIKVTCHWYDKEFTCWRWKDDLVNPVSGYNPRLAFDFFKNVLIIQWIFLCTHGCSTHKERALSVNIKIAFRRWRETHYHSFYHTQVPVLVGLWITWIVKY